MMKLKRKMFFNNTAKESYNLFDSLSKNGIGLEYGNTGFVNKNIASNMINASSGIKGSEYMSMLDPKKMTLQQYNTGLANLKRAARVQTWKNVGKGIGLGAVGLGATAILGAKSLTKED